MRTPEPFSAYGRSQAVRWRTRLAAPCLAEKDFLNTTRMVPGPRHRGTSLIRQRDHLRHAGVGAQRSVIFAIPSVLAGPIRRRPAVRPLRAIGWASLHGVDAGLRLRRAHYAILAIHFAQPSA